MSIPFFSCFHPISEKKTLLNYLYVQHFHIQKKIGKLVICLIGQHIVFDQIPTFQPKTLTPRCVSNEGKSQEGKSDFWCLTKRTVCHFGCLPCENTSGFISTAATRGPYQAPSLLPLCLELQRSEGRREGAPASNGTRLEVSAWSQLSGAFVTKKNGSVELMSRQKRTILYYSFTPTWL